jgi:thioredoxin 2
MSAAMSTDVVQCKRCGRKNRVPAAAEGVPRCGNCQEPLPWITTAGDDDFADVVEQAALPVIVDFWAPWCAPCRMVSPALERLARDLAGRVKFVRVNVDDAPGLADRFAIMAVPTLLVMSNGRVVARQAGTATAPALRIWVDQALEKVS